MGKKQERQRGFEGGCFKSMENLISSRYIPRPGQFVKFHITNSVLVRLLHPYTSSSTSLLLS
jgi:hypothetical protein